MDSDATVPTISADVLDRYLAGQGTPDEVLRVQAWARTHNVEAALAALRGQERTPDAVRAAAVRAASDWAVVERKIEEHSASDVRRVTPDDRARARDDAARRGVPRVRMLGTRTVWAVWSVGVAAIMLLAAALVWRTEPRQPETTRTYATRAGQQATFTLSDGTRVTLAPRTTLRLARFGSMSRTVTLDGQAYFEVAQSTNVPFFVRTGTVVTQVLGTSFLVRYYANDGPAHIAVAAGKVGVLSTIPTRWSALSPVVLTAGHVADVTDSMVNESAVKDLMAETDWLRGQLMFRHAPVREVLRTLSRWYGYQFRCADSTLAQENVTLAVSTHSSAEALATLERILSVHLTVVGDTVTLMPHANQRETRPLHKQEYNVWIPTREVGR